MEKSMFTLSHLPSPVSVVPETLHHNFWCTGGMSGFTITLCTNLETVPVNEFSATAIGYCIE